jgi:hypothetical protein
MCERERGGEGGTGRKKRGKAKERGQRERRCARVCAHARTALGCGVARGPPIVVVVVAGFAMCCHVSSAQRGLLAPQIPQLNAVVLAVAYEVSEPPQAPP